MTVTPFSITSPSAFAARENGPIREFPRPLVYPPGVVLQRQGEQAEEVFYLERGLVKLMRLLPSGEERIVGLRSAGWFVPAAPAILEEPSMATVETVTSSQIARISATRFRALLRSDPKLSWRIHRMHSDEVFSDLVQIAELRATDARERLRGLLKCLADAHEHPSGEALIHLPLRQWELAQLLGVTPPYLCQLLKEFQADGVLRREGQAWMLRLADGFPPTTAAR